MSEPTQNQAKAFPAFPQTSGLDDANVLHVREAVPVSADLRNRFSYHRPVAGMPEKFVEIRHNALELSGIIDALVPNGREKALALTKLEEAVMWANAGLARTAPVE